MFGAGIVTTLAVEDSNRERKQRLLGFQAAQRRNLGANQDGQSSCAERVEQPSAVSQQARSGALRLNLGALPC